MDPDPHEIRFRTRRAWERKRRNWALEKKKKIEAFVEEFYFYYFYFTRGALCVGLP